MSIEKKKVNNQEIITDDPEYEDFDDDSAVGLDAAGILDLIEKIEQRKIYLFGPVTTESMLGVICQIHILEKKDPKSDIELIINSDGGSVSDCLALIDTMDSCKCDIKTIVLGRAASAACLIASNGTAGKRYGGRNAEFMYHEMYGSFFDAKPSHMQYYKNEYERLSKKFNSIFARNTGRKIKDIEEMFCSRELDVWMEAEEARQNGLIDKVLRKRKRNGQEKK